MPYGDVGEHIVTSYIQDGQPLIKYRTHDLVRWTDQPCGCGTTWLYYPGGVLGRTDHMIIVKGVNVYPSALESLLHRVAGLSEHYELHVDRDAANDFVTVKAERGPTSTRAATPSSARTPRPSSNPSSAWASASWSRSPARCRATS